MDWKPTKTQIELAARADGYFNIEYDEHQLIGGKDGNKYGAFIANHKDYRRGLIVPAYDLDHNAVQRLIEGLDDDEYDQYNENMCTIMNIEPTWYICGGDYKINTVPVEICRATAAQKFQAVCKAKGWE